MELLPFFIIVAIEVLVNWFFYKNEKLFAVIVCTAVNCFAIAVIGLAVDIFDIDSLLFIIPVIVLQAAGYKLFLRTNWGKALVASLCAFIAALTVAFLLAKSGVF